MDIGAVKMFVKMIGLHRISQCAFLIYMALEQVDLSELLRLGHTSRS